MLFCTQLFANNTVKYWNPSLSHIISLIAEDSFQIHKTVGYLQRESVFEKLATGPLCVKPNSGICNLSNCKISHRRQSP